MNVSLDYITFLLKCDCCGTNFPDIAFICVMETVINYSSKHMEIIPASFYTEFSHSVKRQNDLKCMKKT